MTKARIIDGKGFALDLRTRIAAQVAALKESQGLEPGLAVVLVGDDPASQVYVRNKGQATLAAGMRSFEHKLPDTVDQATLVALVERLNRDPAVNGILVQLPLPRQIDPAAVIATIDPAKDVDGFHVENAGRRWGFPDWSPARRWAA
jgi:methylenetetrahydrofolate dehydrogenase (NADP+) / methenyltetrahydrofolate cyclohydrolase